MKIKTEMEFQDYLDSELIWRKQEISEIMALLNFSQLSESTTLRISIPMFYAHLEGFTKNICNALTIYLNHQKYKYSELSCSISSLLLKRKFKNLDVSKKNSSFLELNNFVRDGSAVIKFPKNSFLSYSNLTWEIFNDIMVTLGFEINEINIYKINSQKINSLVKLRNDISHGKRIPIDKERCIEFKNLIVECMDLLKGHFENYLKNELFLEKNRVTI